VNSFNVEQREKEKGVEKDNPSPYFTPFSFIHVEIDHSKIIKIR